MESSHHSTIETNGAGELIEPDDWPDGPASLEDSSAEPVEDLASPYRPGGITTPGGGTIMGITGTIWRPVWDPFLHLLWIQFQHTGPRVKIWGGCRFRNLTAEVERELLRTNVKLSDPSDLIISASMECALWTNVETTQNTYGEVFAQVRA